ncbi:restriction endonuclease subunit S [Paenibacillus sp. FSL K6-4396]|uniref:restriction endonuclease subunit S n=1 Tax=Paenibacillus sp. FSL K6-4396 TaxID=2921506 RepID=UPI0030F721E5
MALIKDIFKITKGKKEEEAEVLERSFQRYIQIEDLRHNENLKCCIPNKKSVHVNKSDLIIAWDGANAGTIGVGLEGVIGSTLAKLELKNDKVNPFYVARFLQSKFQYLRDNCTGATIPHISKTVLENLSIPLPSLEIQKRIIEVLDKARRLIDARKKQIRLMDELIQSMFYEMFGDPVTNPKGWKKIQLRKSCDVITGNTPSRKEQDNYGRYIEWIKSDNINTPYTFLTRAEEYLSEKGFEKGRYTEANSILMTCIAGSLSCIGNVAIADRKVAFNQQINAIVPLKYETMFLYVMFLLTKSYIQNASSNSMKGIISKGKLQELEFIVPDRPIQEMFSKKVIFFEGQKELLNQSLTELETKYLSLTQKAFRGDLF